MLKINKSVIIEYTPQQMFELVSDVENYSNCLPWCTRSEIRNHNGNQITGAVYLEYLKIKLYFVTANTQSPYSTIQMQLVEGPFKHLAGLWQFTPLGDHGCRIDFNLEYTFSNILLEKLIGPVFSHISKNIVDCFIKEARRKYSTNIQS